MAELGSDYVFLPQAASDLSDKHEAEIESFKLLLEESKKSSSNQIKELELELDKSRKNVTQLIAEKGDIERNLKRQEQQSKQDIEDLQAQLFDLKKSMLMAIFSYSCSW